MVLILLPVCRHKGSIKDQSNDHEIYPDEGGRILNHREVGLRQEDADIDADTEEDIDLHCCHHDVTLMVDADKSQHDRVRQCVQEHDEERCFACFQGMLHILGLMEKNTWGNKKLVQVVLLQHSLKCQMSASILNLFRTIKFTQLLLLFMVSFITFF